jgi:hypothetical protein
VSMAGKKGGAEVSGAKGDNGIVVLWIVREVGGGTVFPVLTKTNYFNWALLM